MEKIVIAFNTDNAAFQEVPKQDAVARILTKVANDIYDGLTSNVVLDANGNGVGRWIWETDAPRVSVENTRYISEMKEADRPEVVGPAIMWGKSSELMLLRLDNGDLMVAVYPQEETYEMIRDMENF